LIPAGTGFNAYEELSSATTDDLSLEPGSVFDDGDDPLDVVLDDRTARAYSLEGGLGDGFSFDRSPPILDEDDELMIGDEVEDLDEDEDDDDDYEDDDDEE